MISEGMQHWLDLQPPAIKKRCEVVSKEGGGSMYHLSLDGGITKFVPFISRRTGGAENITIPRVSVATSIFGCFIGYCQAFRDIQHPDFKNKAFKNGWYLYDIGYNECIKPHVKEVWDQEDSGEHWLVTYDADTRVYRGNIIAKLFFSEMSYVPKTNTYPRRYVKMLVEVMVPTLVLGGGIDLQEGYWEVVGPDPMQIEKWSSNEGYKTRRLSAGEYATAKKYSADLLSYTEPPSSKW